MAGSSATAQLPIGVFDSGLGGLTVVRRLRELLPQENIIYFGDTGRVPYGTRSEETIRKYALQDTELLLSKGVKLIIAACGTVSSVCRDLGEGLPVPYLNVVDPTVSAAAKATRNHKIGIIGTSATVRSGAYRRALIESNEALRVYEKDCPLFVPLVEYGFATKDDPILQLAVERYLLPIKHAGVDTLILGCTHYPLLSQAIAQYLGKDVELINPGAETAASTAEALGTLGLLRSGATEGYYKFYVSDEPKGFAKTAGKFLGQALEGSVEKQVL
jgi:glutamate racemase